MGKTIRATDRNANERKADKRRRDLIRIQKRHGVFYPSAPGAALEFGDVAVLVQGATDGNYKAK